jgi:hypothetical protein
MLVVIGVVGAGAGRFLLPLATKGSRKWLPKKRVATLLGVVLLARVDWAERLHISPST